MTLPGRVWPGLRFVGIILVFVHAGADVRAQESRQGAPQGDQTTQGAPVEPGDAPMENAAGLAQDIETLGRTIDQRLTAIDRRENELAELSKQVDRIVALLGESRVSNATLRSRASVLTTEVERCAATRRELDAKLVALREERDVLTGRLDALGAEATTNMEEMALLQRSLEAALETIKEETEKTDVQAREIARLGRSVETLSRDNEALKRELADLRAAKSETEGRVATLTRALETSEAKAREQEGRLAALNARLAEALAARVDRLARYRSDFFGRLRDILGDRREVRVVGDRFVFQSEVLFASGSADLGIAGRRQLTRLAGTLRDIAARIPADLNWILRVDGHTDRQPIATARFPSNWELSTARALAVVRFLIDQGIPAKRLVAAGFGEHHPLDPRDDEIARRRNRRIEFKLTQR